MGFDFYITPEDYLKAETFGVCRQALEYRVRTACWSKERAIQTPPRKFTSYKYWSKVAVANGIKYNTFVSRVKCLGWDVERAATQPTADAQSRKDMCLILVDLNRKYPIEFVKMAEDSGIPVDTFRKRVKRGWDMQEAATRPVMTPRECALLAKRYTFVFGNGRCLN